MVATRGGQVAGTGSITPVAARQRKFPLVDCNRGGYVGDSGGGSWESAGTVDRWDISLATTPPRVHRETRYPRYCRVMTQRSTTQ